jgi:hypothetical protein
MPKDLWQPLGIGLQSDHRLNMESVNTSRDSMLGVIENIPLDFGGGQMFFHTGNGMRELRDSSWAPIFHSHFMSHFRSP